MTGLKVTQDTFEIGDYAKSLAYVRFINKDEHIKDGLYLVTEENKCYFNVMRSIYEKV